MPQGGRRSSTWTKEKPPPSPRKGHKKRKTVLREAFGVKKWQDLQLFVEGKGLEKLLKEMGTLSKKDYAVVYLSLCEFIKPKLQRTMVEGNPDNPVKFEITFNLG